MLQKEKSQKFKEEIERLKNEHRQEQELKAKKRIENATKRKQIGMSQHYPHLYLLILGKFKKKLGKSKVQRSTSNK